MFTLWKTLLRERKDKLQTWGKIFAHHIADKGLLSRIYEDISKLTKTKKMDKRYFTGEGLRLGRNLYSQLKLANED